MPPRLVKSKEVAMSLGCSKGSLATKMPKLLALGLRRVRVGEKGQASLFDGASLDDLIRRVVIGEVVLP